MISVSIGLLFEKFTSIFGQWPYMLVFQLWKIKIYGVTLTKWADEFVFFLFLSTLSYKTNSDLAQYFDDLKFSPCKYNRRTMQWKLEFILALLILNRKTVFFFSVSFFFAMTQKPDFDQPSHEQHHVYPYLIREFW